MVKANLLSQNDSKNCIAEFKMNLNITFWDVVEKLCTKNWNLQLGHGSICNGGSITCRTSENHIGYDNDQIIDFVLPKHWFPQQISVCLNASEAVLVNKWIKDTKPAHSEEKNEYANQKLD